MNTYADDLFNLRNRVALIIGGGGYLCSAIAKGFALSGAKVVIADLRIEKAKKVSQSINALGAESRAMAFDVTNKDEHEEALKEIVKYYDCLDVLVNGAGINSPTPFLELSLEEWHRVMDSQITGTFLGCQVFGDHMVKNRTGSIINISSASAGPPLSKAFPYSVAKAGIKNLTQNLAREWATKGVRVNAIRPGFFPTEWNQENFITKEREQAILSHTPMGRYGESKELIGATVWLASEASSFVTGTEVTIDGGFSCMSI